MAHNRTGNTHKPSGGGEKDRATLADQWVDKNWYLPPGGDQSWREREARRRFGSDGEEPVNDDAYPSAAAPDDPTTDEMRRVYGNRFKPSRALGILLPVSLAACAVLFVPIFMPRILTSDFWTPYEPKASSATPVQMMTQTAMEGDVTMRPAYGDGSDHGKAASQTLPQQTGQAVAPIKIYRNTVVPNPRPAVVARDDRKDKDREPLAPAANAQPVRALSSKTRPAKSLPPIGAAYFASHAPAAKKQMADSSSPIGQAYFESHSPATD